MAKTQTDAPDQIKPSDYKPYDKIIGNGPCAACGTLKIHYIERLTKEREVTKAPAKRICKECYEKAVKQTAETYRTLPGIIDPGVLRPLAFPKGLCSVCQTQKPTWSDSSRELLLCETCYSNVVRSGETCVS